MAVIHLSTYLYCCSLVVFLSFKGKESLKNFKVSTDVTFLDGARLPASRLVVTAMLDFQNFRKLGKGGGEGTSTSPLATPSTLANLPVTVSRLLI